LRLSAWVAAHSVTTIKVSKLYDQTGNGFHATQAALANMPTLVLSTLGSHPAIVFTAANSQQLGNSSYTSAVGSVTGSAVSGVYQRTGTSLGMVLGFVGVGFLGANNPTQGLY
jgi:hypothetical protein